MIKTALTPRELDMLRICKETGVEYMASRWTYVNSRIIAELPNPTLSEGVSTQFNAALQDISALILNILDYGMAHSINLGTAEEMINIMKEQVSIIVLNVLEERKAGMN